MTTRRCNLTLAFVALMSLSASSAIAAESVDGTIESLTDRNISIKDKGGKLFFRNARAKNRNAKKCPLSQSERRQ